MQVAKLSQASSNNLHSPSNPGILALDLHPEGELALTGGNDGSAIVFNLKTKQIADTLKAHKKRVTDVHFHPTQQVAVTTSADHTAIVWAKNSSGKFAVGHTLKEHKDEVVGATIHPSGEYLVTASADRSWAFWDIKTGSLKKQVTDAKAEAGCTKVLFHPDGLILGVGTADRSVDRSIGQHSSS